MSYLELPWLVLSTVALCSPFRVACVIARFVLSYFVLSCLVLSCLVLSCLALSCRVLSCLALSCLVLSCLALPCLVVSCLVMSRISNLGQQLFRRPLTTVNVSAATLQVGILSLLVLFLSLSSLALSSCLTFRWVLQAWSCKRPCLVIDVPCIISIFFVLCFCPYHVLVTLVFPCLAPFGLVFVLPSLACPYSSLALPPRRCRWKCFRRSMTTTGRSLLGLCLFSLSLPAGLPVSCCCCLSCGCLVVVLWLFL
jgi:hypothetical protein